MGSLPLTLVNSQFDPENHPFFVETFIFQLPTHGRVELLIYQRLESMDRWLDHVRFYVR